jgi:trimeric autotransporter adhesin
MIFSFLVTNANGTDTAYSLASLGITSLINANAVNVALRDSSSIDGETTFTTSSGSTGIAATIALNAGGSTALSRILNASADGSAGRVHDLIKGQTYA